MSALFATTAYAQVSHIPRLALEVLNPEDTDRHLIHLEDMIGPEARDIGPHRRARALLIASVSGLQCEPADGDRRARTPAEIEASARCDKDLNTLDQIAKETRKLGGQVVVVVQVPRPQDAESARQNFEGRSHEVILALDTYGLTKRRLGFVAARQALVIRSDGKVTVQMKNGKFAAAGRQMKKILEEDRL